MWARTYAKCCVMKRHMYNFICNVCSISSLCKLLSLRMPLRQVRLHVHCHRVHNVLHALLSSCHPHKNANFSQQRSRNKHCARPQGAADTRSGRPRREAAHSKDGCMPPQHQHVRSFAPMCTCPMICSVGIEQANVRASNEHFRHPYFCDFWLLETLLLRGMERPEPSRAFKLPSI